MKYRMMWEALKETAEVMIADGIVGELSGEHLNYGECTGGWYYNGLARPVNCPLMEVEDGNSSI